MIKKLCLISIICSASLVFAESSSVTINMEPVIASIADKGNSKVLAYSRGSTVTVYGIVTSEEMKEEAVRALKSQAGVEAVEDLIVVNPTFGKKIPTDAELKHSIENALKDLGTEFETLEVTKGEVFISSDLASFREVDQMLATILGIDGVREIKTSTLVNGKPYLSDVTKNY